VSRGQPYCFAQTSRSPAGSLWNECYVAPDLRCGLRGASSEGLTVELALLLLTALLLLLLAPVYLG
jgi:hypothetical protein